MKNKKLTLFLFKEKVVTLQADYKALFGQLSKRTRSVDESSTVSCRSEHGQLMKRARSVDESSMVSLVIDHGEL